MESCLPLHSRKCERQAPLDVLLAYHHRLTSCVAALPYSIALDWIQRRTKKSVRSGQTYIARAPSPWASSSSIFWRPGR